MPQAASQRPCRRQQAFPCEGKVVLCFSPKSREPDEVERWISTETHPQLPAEHHPPARKPSANGSHFQQMQLLPPVHRKDRFASASGAQKNFDLIRLALLGTFPFSGEGIRAESPLAPARAKLKHRAGNEPAPMPRAASLPLLRGRHSHGKPTGFPRERS